MPSAAPLRRSASQSVLFSPEAEILRSAYSSADPAKWPAEERRSDGASEALPQVELRSGEVRDDECHL